MNRRDALLMLLLPAAGAAPAADADSFFRAVNVDDARTVTGLLARGFDPNATDPQGQVGLYLALREDAPKVAAALLAHPAVRLDAGNAAGETPMMMAALRGQTEWVQRLLDRGVPADRDGWTALHYAASGPETRVVALLLDRGARIDALSPNRTTALMMAARYGAETSVDLLVARGADPKLRNDKSLNAADFARLGAREPLAARLDRLAR